MAVFGWLEPYNRNEALTAGKLATIMVIALLLLSIGAVLGALADSMQEGKL